MNKRHLLNLIASLGLAFGIVSCSTTKDDPESMLEKREKDGRIAMVLGESQLEIDGSLSGQVIILPILDFVESWPQSGGNATKASVHATAAKNLQISWSAQAGVGSSVHSAISTPPVSDGRQVFVLDAEQNVLALNVTDGSRLWSTKLQAANLVDTVASGGGLAVSGDTLVVASGFGFVTALSASTGSVIWRREIGTPVVGAPTILDNVAYVITNNNEVYAVNIKTGNVTWSEQGFAETARLLASPSPAAIEDIVVVPYSSGEVVAYLTANGRRLWVDSLDRGNQFTPISSINDIPGRPVLGVGQRVYVSNQSGLTAAIDARTGARVWEQPIGSTQTPALVGDTLFVSGLGGQITAINAPAGGVHWITNLPAFMDIEKSKGRLAYLGPILASERLLTIGSNGVLYALNPETGDEISTLNLKGEFYVEPIIVGDKILLYSDSGKLIAID